ncbi:MAG: branched-chain amino acid ABC transporter permease [Pseudomonadota bacterium]|nr:branched-chain amino acid ABC transporter permease [Pseudomonadota bacterium]
MLAQQLINALGLGAVYALFALGFTLVFGILGVINLAHGAVFMLGSYCALLLVTRLAWGILPALAGAMVLCGLLGMLSDWLLLRPLRARNAPHLAPMIATIGLAGILGSIAQAGFGVDTQRFPPGTIPDAVLHLGGAEISWIQFDIIIVAVLLMGGLFVLLERSPLGRQLRAVAESPRHARLLGIRVERVFLLVAALAGALGGAAGVLIGLSFNAISPFMGQPMLHKGIAVIILGGMGDVRGALFGGLFLGLAEVLTVTWWSSDVRDAVAFGLLLLVLVLRPSGLFGRTLIRRA